MRTFNVIGEFRPVFEVTIRIEPFNEDAVDPSGFLALEGGAGLLLQEDGESFIYLQSAVTALTADSTVYSADSTTATADQTFVLNTS